MRKILTAAALVIGGFASAPYVGSDSSPDVAVLAAELTTVPQGNTIECNQFKNPKRGDECRDTKTMIACTLPRCDNASSHICEHGWAVTWVPVYLCEYVGETTENYWEGEHLETAGNLPATLSCKRGFVALGFNIAKYAIYCGKLDVKPIDPAVFIVRGNGCRFVVGWHDERKMAVCVEYPPAKAQPQVNR